jgi:hypothetical protein
MRHLPLAIPLRDVPAPEPGAEEPSSEPCSPRSRWEGPRGVADDAEDEFDHVAALAELLKIGTRVLCRSIGTSTGTQI